MERALTVTVDFGRREAWTAEERSGEIAELASSALAKVIRNEIVRRHEPTPAYFIGSGKAEELGALCREDKIDVVIFNNELSPSQQKNLEKTIGARVIDRTQLILHIFARRARSNEGKLQVELAQLSYLLPRLVGKGVEMSRTGGGIGTSGPGEQKLEVDRRRIRDRVAKIKRDLAGMEKRRGMMRSHRARRALATIALVGYTNVGKSTLLNALTESDVIVRDKLFATLDPTIRKFVLPNRQKVLFIDTVGFIKDLPHNLVEAFKATLEEVVEADLLVHVVDASHPKAVEQADAVYEVLTEIGAADKNVVTVLNKTDTVQGRAAMGLLSGKFDNPIAISALKKSGFNELIERIADETKDSAVPFSITLPVQDVKTLSLIQESGSITSQIYDGDMLHIEALVPPALKEKLSNPLDI